MAGTQQGTQPGYDLTAPNAKNSHNVTDYKNSIQGQQYYAKQQSGPYRGGLLTDFRGSNALDSNSFGGSGGATNLIALTDQDSDVRGAAAAQNELDKESAGDTGVSNAEQMAILNGYKARIGLKNSLSEQIGGSDAQTKSELDAEKAISGSAVGQGIKTTRTNYNGRGLLYSGMREGGEQNIRQAGASQLASSMAATTREGANAKTAAQNAYASVDLANQQEMLQRSNEAFDTASANSIARRQALQQLGAGVGGAMGSIVGSSSPSGPSYQNPANGYEFNGLQRTGLLASSGAD